MGIGDQSLPDDDISHCVLHGDDIHEDESVELFEQLKVASTCRDVLNPGESILDQS